MKAARMLLIVFSAALTDCGHGPGQSAVPQPPAVPRPPAVPKLLHSPPIAQLAPQQLRSLSMECEKYLPDKSTRGPYDAQYCEDAIAAWADSPLQIVPLGKDASIPNLPGSPKPDSPNPGSPK